ncbi:MAG TPA: prepilin-type N-terminal cleavage/methylation domain-containing protein [Humisphaera sp.]
MPTLIRRRRARRGLSLMEAMISMSITTMLLTGIASAFVAASSAMETNDQFFRATQAARVTMNQVLVECRRADAVMAGAGGATNYFDVIRPVEVLEPNESYRRYKFDASTKQVTLTIYKTDGTTIGPYTMVRNVESAVFGPPQMGVDANNATVVQRLPVTLKVTVGKNTVTLNGAAGPRRAMKF